jgi:hypothetical protein
MVADRVRLMLGSEDSGFASGFAVVVRRAPLSELRETGASAGRGRCFLDGAGDQALFAFARAGLAGWRYGPGLLRAIRGRSLRSAR